MVNFKLIPSWCCFFFFWNRATPFHYSHNGITKFKVRKETRKGVRIQTILGKPTHRHSSSSSLSQGKKPKTPISRTNHPNSFRGTESKSNTGHRLKSLHTGRPPKQLSNINFAHQQSSFGAAQILSMFDAFLFSIFAPRSSASLSSPVSSPARYVRNPQAE